MRGAAWALGLFLISFPGAAYAHQPPPEYEDVRPASAFLEVAPWLGLGGGASDVGRGNAPLFAMSLDVGATVRLSDELRAGLWVAARTASFATFEPTGGLRFTWSPEEVHWFGVDGRWTIALDAGAGWAWRDASRFGLPDGPVAVGRVSWGFTAPLRLLDAYPWHCEGRPSYPGERCVPPVGVVSGFRVVAEVRRGLAPVEEWEAVLVLELEVLGAGWFLSGGG